MNIQTSHSSSLSSLELIAFLDVTYLAPETHFPTLENLCQSIQKAPFLPAGICVFAQNLPLIKNFLHHLPLAFIAVINFPKGNDAPHAVQKQILEALLLGANELDIVVPYQDYLTHKNLSAMKDFMSLCHQTVGHQAQLKFILETGVLQQEDIYALSRLACENGANFIKTSTGKTEVGATLASTRTILQAISDHHAKHQEKIGLKISGGIHSLQQVQQYIQLISSEVGAAWLNPQLFRIGASQLLNHLLS